MEGGKTSSESILGESAKLQTAIINTVMSACLPVHLHGTTRHLPDGPH